MQYYGFLFSTGHRLCLWGVKLGAEALEAELVYFGMNLPETLSLYVTKDKQIVRVKVPNEARNSPIGGKATRVIFEVKLSER